MANRFTYLFRDKTSLSAPNCPVIVSERALLRDLEKNRSLAQLKFTSITEFPIIALTATICYTTVTGQPLGTTVYQYQNLFCAHDESFGQDKPVLIPDASARAFSVIHMAVTFRDGSTWEDFISMKPQTAPTPTPTAQSAAISEQQLRQAAARREQLARKAKEREAQQALEAVERKERMAQEAAERKERMAQEAAKRKEQLAREAALRKERLAQQAAAKEAAKQEKQYEKAAEMLLYAKKAKDYRKAEALFRALGDYRDSMEQADLCAAKLTALEEASAKDKSPKVQTSAEASDGQNIPVSEDDTDVPKQTKTKKIVKIAVAAAVIVALAVAAVPVSKTYIIPAVKYAQAEKLAQNSAYDEAIEIFAELYDYKDAQHRTWQTTYDKGIYLMEHCDYPAAISTFNELNDFEDARERVKECEYLYGDALMGEKQYADAVGHLLASDGFADADGLVNDCYLLWAEEEYLATNYESAVDLVKRVPDLSMESTPDFYWDAAYQTALYHLEQGNFRDAVQLFGEVIEHGITDELLNIHDLRRDAMYAYVTSHNDNTDLHTFTYLMELAESNYKDCKKLYETLYAWSAEITANNSSTTKEGQSTITGTKTCYFHIVLKGGEPDDSIPVYAKVRYPGGKTEQTELGILQHNGYEYVSFNSWGNYPKGNCTVTVYNGETNQAIGTHTVKIS